VGKRRQAAGDLPGAIRCLERASQLQPAFADVQFLLGQVYVEADRPQPARLAYERALGLNPRYLEARLGLARVLALVGEPDMALASLREAAQHIPELATGPMAPWLSPHSPETSPRSAAHLEALLTQLLEAPPLPLAAGIDSARRALRTGDNRRAIGEIKQLLREHPQFPDLHNLLGVAYDNEDMVDDAVEEFERALALNPHFAEARLNLGLTLFHRGRHGQAEKHLRRIEEHHPGHVLARTILSDIETARSSS